jgi:4-hydroxybutyrate dehydrogenase
MLATFAFPAPTVFGAGAIAELAARLKQIGVSRPLLVTDPGLLDTEAFKSVQRRVPAATVFSGVHSNPIQQDVEDATAAFLKSNSDSVIAVGGGSALDVGKLVRLRAKFREHPFTDLANAPLSGKLAAFIAIPTTAGTGSEVGRSSVITIAGKKHVIFKPELLADLIILDPQLTVALPAKLTAATGADALTHCIESFTSPTFHPLCDAVALEGIHLVLQSLLRAVEEPNDLDARGKMQIAAMMGGIAFQKDLGAAHSLAHPLSAMCGVHHGTANALVLPTVMRFNAVQKPGLYRRVGIAMELQDPTDAEVIAVVDRLFASIGLATGLTAAGVKESQLPALADQAYQDSCHLTNPVPVSREDLLQMYREAM